MELVSRPSNSRRALVVDLDGTLIRCNSFYREFLTIVSSGRLMSLLLELVKSKSWTRSQIKVAVSRSCCDLDYRACISKQVQGLIEDALSQNLPVILATGASELTAERIVAQLDLRIPLIASTKARNLTGKTKAQALVALFGEQNFKYVGDSKADLEVFKHAYDGVLVSDDVGLTLTARKRFPNLTILPKEGSCGH